MTAAADRTETATEEDRQCSKCSGPLDTTGTPHWCKGCRAKYKRDYEALVKELRESRGYAAGQAAMRAYLAQNFDRLGSSMYSGREIAATIRGVKLPSDA